jgi:hypothetical protein
MDWLFRYADPTIDWNYAMITLLVRFIGVFIVMLVMQLALQASSRILRLYERRGESTGASPAVAAFEEPLAEAAGIEDAELAAIALALALEARPPVAAALESGAGPSPWSVAGRMQQLQRAPRRG